MGIIPPFFDLNVIKENNPVPMVSLYVVITLK